MWPRLTVVVSAAAVAIGACAVLTASTPAPTFAGLDREPLRFGPSWLPDGLTELGRQYGAPVREWALVPDDPSGDNWQMLELRPTFHCLDQRDPVDIDGRPGWFRERGHVLHLRGVCWQFDRHTYLELNTTLPTLTRDDLIRIARSVRPDPGSISFPISEPPDAPTSFGLGGDPGWRRLRGRSPTDWTATVSWSPSSRNGRQHLTITAGRDTAAPDGGQPMTVRGRPARYISDDNSPAGNSTYLVVDLGARRYLTIRVDTYPGPAVASFTLTAIAERTTVDLSRQPWIAARNLTG